jgi:hypothetical protein
MAVVNTIAYYDMATITFVKRFIVQAPGYQSDKTFFFVTDAPG